MSELNTLTESDRSRPVMAPARSRVTLGLPLALVLALFPVALAAAAGGGDDVSTARELARGGKRTEAIAILNRHLETQRDDSDARTLLGTVLSWEGRYDEARTNLREVLSRNGNHYDAVRALINVELWSGHPAAAEQIATDALRASPASADLLVARARARSAQNKVADARNDVDQVLVLEPNNEQALQMRTSLKARSLPWVVGSTYSVDWFHPARGNWREEELYLKRETGYGSIIGRYSRAQHFDRTDDQLELEAWPHLWQGAYAYLEYGHSFDDNVVYPDHRMGAEVWQGLGHGFEASLGYRRLYFPKNEEAPGANTDRRERATRVNIDTASLGKYYGDWLFTFRVYALPDTDGDSRSYHLSARRYFGDGTDYWGVRVAHGRFREELRTLDEFSFKNSDTIAGELWMHLAPRWVLSARASVSRTDRVSLSDLDQYSASIGLYYRF